ncbi:hypothetical protein [Thermogemmata fonticola]|uniref:DUF2029 domain-containing protein n=1 Tax=Thermogemmata fonticola TaxID=2755323 RepID=A0A7V8VAS5_9BACT|nr:hypothetical protein [Thermogemmata fonticola]MBA2224606.1 hypothetical protein [Thermogemmata fonticola]
MIRVLADLVLERRPLMHVNLTAAGLVCLGLGLAVGLSAVALRRTANEQAELGRHPPPLQQVHEQATAVVARTTAEVTSTREVHYLCERLLALCCHAAILVGLFYVGWRHYQETLTGVAMATLYLLLPYTAYHIDQLHHVWPSAFVVWALAWYRRPVWAGFLVGVASGTSLFPLFLLPAWWGFYAGRGAGRFLIAAGGALLFTITLTASIYWLDGLYVTRLIAAMHLWEWQLWHLPAREGIWTAVHWAYRLPVFVLFIAFVIASAFWPRPRNLAHLIAFNAAIVLGVQFWYADCGGIYVLWYLPLLILLVCRPNLTLAEPPASMGNLMTRLTLWGNRRPAAVQGTAKELAV